MSDDAASVVAKLTTEFGPGCSSGIHAILMHESLPEHFGKSEWAEWFFKPANTAFERAHDMGLIAPWKLGSKWSFTPLGLAVRQHLIAEGEG